MYLSPSSLCIALPINSNPLIAVQMGRPLEILRKRMLCETPIDKSSTARQFYKQILKVGFSFSWVSLRRQATPGCADSRPGVTRDSIDYCLSCEAPSADPKSASQTEMARCEIILIPTADLPKYDTNSPVRPLKGKIKPPEPTESKTVLFACMAASAEEWSGQLALKLIPVQPLQVVGMQRRLYWKPHGWSWSCLKAGQAGTGCMGEERLTARTHTNTHMWIS